MATAATWLIVVGFLLLVLGLILRTVIMMMSSDATPEGRMLHGRELRAQYTRVFPRSSTPRNSRVALIAGAVLLLIGIGLEIRR